MTPALALLLLLAVALLTIEAALARRRANRLEALLRTIPAQPTRAERIAWAHGMINACKGAELALADHTGDLSAALLLAGYRAKAAIAKSELVALGEGPDGERGRWDVGHAR